MTGWRPAATPLPAQERGGALAALAKRRYSAWLDDNTTIDRERATHHAQRAAALACTDSPVASAGNLHPTNLFVLAAKQNGVVNVSHISAEGRRAVTTIGSEDVRSCFVADRGLDRAFALGAAAIVIAQDARRETAKYGNRGWRYCEIETGSYAHHLALTLTEADCEHRIIGGFFETPLATVLGLGESELELVLTIVVTGGRLRC
jgi:hypothetical protein